MNTKHLEYLLEVYRCRSINKAAKYCFISQSYLSKIIKDLENEAGFPVVLRTTSGLTFTKEGLLFIESAGKIVQETNRIKKIPHLLDESQSLAVACSPTSFIVQCFFEFKERYPAEPSRDVINEAGLREIVQKILSGEFNLGVMVMFEEKAHKYGLLADKYNLDMQLLNRDIPIMAVMGKNHPLASKERVSLEDLSQHPFAVDAHVDFDDTLGILNIRPTQSVLSVVGRGSLIDALHKGGYITTMINIPKWDATTYGLCCKSIYDLKKSMAVYSLKPNSLLSSDRERQFVSHLKYRLNEYYHNGRNYSGY